MKKLLTIALTLFFALPMFAQEILKEKQQEDIDDKNAPKVQHKQSDKVKKIADQYVFVLDDDKIESFIKNVTKNKKEFKTRDEKMQAYEKFEKVASQKVLQVAEKMGVDKNKISQVYVGSFSGFAVNIKEDKVKDIVAKAKAKNVDFSNLKGICQDFEINLNSVVDATEVTAAPQAQSTPWGISRVGSADYTGYYWAWVIDTGIDLDHPDLNVAYSGWHRTYVPGTSSANDDHGHGSHCAGIIAARNNTIGVKGVAAGATVVPVKVLNSAGNGEWSWILAGVQYVNSVAWSGDVVNMSLGGGAPSSWDEFWYWATGDDRLDMENAIRAGANKGIRYILAAGNDAQSATNQTPARINGTNIYTVSAMNWYGCLADFSNYGTPVDYAEPGVDNYSCYKNGGYAYMSGTSMAAPHLAGILLSTGGTVRNGGIICGDKDSSADRIGIR
ncbi:MAG TPA: S8 family serine peptidase [Chitinophagales bacterium]|nr:S8 family serine peptidase [Chitinophagales bacterium]HNL05917.1 S8 family serine peptidase [Chitinophagales bacterium]